MSQYWFIAADYPLEEVDLSGFVKIKVRDIKKMNPLPSGPISFDKLDEDMEVLYSSNEEETGGLIVSICSNPPYGLYGYIKRKYIYWLQGNNLDSKWHKQLSDYLSENINKGTQVEIWSILFGAGLQTIPHKEIKFSDFNSINFRILTSTNNCISICME